MAHPTTQELHPTMTQALKPFVDPNPALPHGSRSNDDAIRTSKRRGATIVSLPASITADDVELVFKKIEDGTIKLEWIGSDEYCTWYIKEDDKEIADGILIGSEDSNEVLINGYKDFMFDAMYREGGHGCESEEHYAALFDDIDWHNNYQNLHDMKDYLKQVARKRNIKDLEYTQIHEIVNLLQSRDI